MSSSRLTRPSSFLASTRASPNAMDYTQLDSNIGDSFSTARKDTDHPSTATKMRRHRSTVDSDAMSFASLNRDLISQLTPSPTEPRNTTMTTPPPPALSYLRYSSDSHETTSLPNHIFQRGLIDERYSDITIIAFGQTYRLHRLILDRAPFFATALSGPWAESNARELTLFPQDVDSNITQEAFEKTLQCIYGKTITANTEEKAAGILATACWLELQGLINCSTGWMLRLLNPAALSWPIRFVTTNYYGRPGQVILTAAKSMLCRDGWEMPVDYWDNIPGGIVREVIGSDGFFVDGEWSRWLFAKRLFNRRLKQRATTSGLLHLNSSGKAKIPKLSCLKTLKFDTWSRREPAGTVIDLSERYHPWLNLYSHPDVEPLLYLLEEGIHYIHLSYEQLQYIRAANDFLGLPLVSERVITNALWNAMELRQIVKNSKEHETELGLSIPGRISNDETNAFPVNISSVSPCQGSGNTRKGKGKVTDVQLAEDGQQGELRLRDSSVDNPQRFWIPSVDSNCLVGRDDIMSLGPSLPPLRSSANVDDASNMQCTNKYAMQDEKSLFHKNSLNSGGTTTATLMNKAKPVAYSKYPPFRFAVKFANPGLLQENKRAYSRTVFYAGSFWRIYIQRKRSTKGVQLGVYLHRAKENEAEDVGLSGISVKEIGEGLRTVTETIGMMERGLFRTDQRRSSMFDSSQPYSLGQSDNYANNDANVLFTTANVSGTALNSRSAYTRSMSSRYGIPTSPSPDGDCLADLAIGTEGDAYDEDDEDECDPEDYYLNDEQSYTVEYDEEEEEDCQQISSQKNQNDCDNASEKGNDNEHSDDLDTHTPHLYDSSSPLANCHQRRKATNTDPLTCEPLRYCHGYGRRRHHHQNNNQNQNQNNPDRLRKAQIQSQNPTLPPYIDTRPTIRTYFKIYNPSKGGRALSVYQSAPDNFNFSQSWGWKSNSMLEDDDADDDDDDENFDGAQNGNEGEGERLDRAKEGKGAVQTENAATASASAAAVFAARRSSAIRAAEGIGSSGSSSGGGGDGGTSGGVSNGDKPAGANDLRDTLSLSHSRSDHSSKSKPKTSLNQIPTAKKLAKWKRRKGVLRFMVVIGNV